MLWGNYWYQREIPEQTKCKVDDLNTSSISYWSIIIIFLNNKKILTTSRLQFSGTLISDFKQKSAPFNSYFFSPYFFSQCTPINTSRKLPVYVYKTENSIDSVDIKEEGKISLLKNWLLTDGMTFLLEWLSFVVNLLRFL